MKIAFVMGDREAAETEIAKNCALWHRRMGYKVVIASSWPGSELGRVYNGVMADTLTSVDHLIPFDPKQGHAHWQLHLRIALAVRLGGAAIAFKDPEIDAVVLGDSDTLMLCGPDYLLRLYQGQDGFALTLPFQRRKEAPFGWFSYLGMVLARKGFEKLQQRLPDILATLYACGSQVSVHGLLHYIFRQSGLKMRTSTLRGKYLLPGGDQKALLSFRMPEDSWLNCGHTVWSMYNQPLFLHACMKTRLDTGMPVAEYFTSFANWATARWDLPRFEHPQPAFAHEPDFARRWRVTYMQVQDTLRRAGVSDPERAFWQDQSAMQRAARHYREHGVLPEPKGPPVVGEVTPITEMTMRRILLPA